MKFKLSQATLNTLKKSIPNNFKLTKRQSNYYNSKKFYQKRPDLAPRNIYLREGRVVKMEEVKKTIDNFGATPFEKICNWFKSKYNDLKMFLVK